MSAGFSNKGGEQLRVDDEIKDSSILVELSKSSLSNGSVVERVPNTWQNCMFSHITPDRV